MMPRRTALVSRTLTSYSHTQPGLAALHKVHPDVEVHVAAVDETLDEVRSDAPTTREA